MEEIGKVFSYYERVGVAAIKLSGSLEVGDTIHIKGHTTDFEQEVDSMQIEHDEVEIANGGDEVGLKVNEKVRKNDTVYLVE